MNIRGMLLLVLLYVLYVSSIPQRHRRISKKEEQPKEKFCGDKLRSTMNVVCKGNYHGNIKRGGGKNRNDDFEDLLESYKETNYDEYRYPFIPRELAESLVSRKVRRDEEEEETNITKECCDNPCAKKELQTYCGL